MNNLMFNFYQTQIPKKSTKNASELTFFSFFNCKEINGLVLRFTMSNRGLQSVCKIPINNADARLVTVTLLTRRTNSS